MSNGPFADFQNEVYLKGLLGELPTSPFGAQVLYAGHGNTALVAEPGQSWDAVLLVRYPSRAAFSAMVRDPAYGEGTSLRTTALEEAVLQATTPWDGPA